MISNKKIKLKLGNILDELELCREFYQINCPNYLEELDDSIKELHNARQGLYLVDKNV
jgi:hypothetical protein